MVFEGMSIFAGEGTKANERLRIQHCLTVIVTSDALEPLSKTSDQSRRPSTEMCSNATHQPNQHLIGVLFGIVERHRYSLRGAITDFKPPVRLFWHESCVKPAKLHYAIFLFDD
ncbi:hypothetical protein TNCT_43021 [Trichonephila clavata]|uniref:Uncharacterized protein n=1 Tax=Trichonephila clavata TaxID=2740835 RepID=A0A8X6GPP5_TRICU|nr:hypothetical protein TNCT_43021 [Trichonephila clavata]